MTEELETGWHTDTPADDTFLRRFVLALAEAWHAAADASEGRVLHDRRFVATDLGRPTGLFNSVTVVQPLHGDDLDEALGDIESFTDAEGTGDVLLWSPWPLPRPGRLGWQLRGYPPMVLRPVSPVEAPAPPDELHIREVVDAAGLDDWCTTVVDAYPLDEVKPYRPAAMLHEAILGDDRYRLLVGYVDGRPVCVGSQFVSHGLNLLLLAACLPEARGRGYYRAMAAHRLASQTDLPAAALVSDMSRPILVSRFGFLPLTRFTLWTRSRH